ncbi:MAG: 30S ribosomal protein S16 [Bdellovibrionales bacterium]|jgi:small subunit ribosomal protein S16
MVVIRLARFGKKHLPRYRVTVADQKYAATGRFIEIVGQYNPKPTGKETELKLDLEKINLWMKNGAQPTERVLGLIKKAQKAT